MSDSPESIVPQAVIAVSGGGLALLGDRVIAFFRGQREREEEIALAKELAEIKAQLRAVLERLEKQDDLGVRLARVEEWLRGHERVCHPKRRGK